MVDSNKRFHFSLSTIENDISFFGNDFKERKTALFIIIQMVVGLGAPSDEQAIIHNTHNT